MSEQTFAHNNMGTSPENIFFCVNSQIGPGDLSEADGRLLGNWYLQAETRSTANEDVELIW